MSRFKLAWVALFCLFSPIAYARSRPLHIYFIDVEGGQATLLVTPSRQSVLIDTGWAGGRDAGRIVSAAQSAGLKRIDFVVITHYHDDHVGGVADLAARFKVGTYVDHGDNTEDSAKHNYDAYLELVEHAERVVVKPNEGLPLRDLKLEFLAAGGQVIKDPLPGAGEANFNCGSETAPENATENSQSVGMLVSYGKFHFLDLGDLVEKKELELVCPNNLIGTVDLYLTTHHGAYPDNPKALVWALHPVVAVMNNGAHKGGNPKAWQIVHDSPGLAGFWQLHYAVDGGKDHNVAEDFIANTDEASDGHYLEVTADPDGRFQVINSRNGYRQKYGKD